MREFNFKIITVTINKLMLMFIFLCLCLCFQASIGLCLEENEISNVATLKSHSFFYVVLSEDIDRNLMDKISHIFPQKMLLTKKSNHTEKGKGYTKYPVISFRVDNSIKFNY